MCQTSVSSIQSVWNRKQFMNLARAYTFQRCHGSISYSVVHDGIVLFLPQEVQNRGLVSHSQMSRSHKAQFWKLGRERNLGFLIVIWSTYTWSLSYNARSSATAGLPCCEEVMSHRGNRGCETYTSSSLERKYVIRLYTSYIHLQGNPGLYWLERVENLQQKDKKETDFGVINIKIIYIHLTKSYSGLLWEMSPIKVCHTPV